MVRVKKQKIHIRRKDSIFQKRPGISLKAIAKFLAGLVVLGTIGFGLIRFKYMFMDSGHFLVQGVDVNLHDESGAERRMALQDIVDTTIIGSNIFTVDLNVLRDNIEIAHPEFKDIVVRRILPNRLVVEGLLRRAIAQIRSDRYYPVDRDGVLLPDVVNFPNPTLPIITGIGINLAKVSRARPANFEEQKLTNALLLINELAANEKLSGYRLKVADITDPGNLTFALENINVEIKIGSSDFRDRLEVLATVIDQLGQDINNFKYIDLRFEDPIMGPK